MIRTAATAAAVLLLAACNQSIAPPAPAPPAAPVPPPALAAAPAPVAPANEGKTIPAAFQGEWMAAASDCAAGVSDSRLRISADQLLFHESSGPVTSVSLATPDDITVHAAMSGEGEGPNDATFHFVLTDGGETLVDVGNAFNRHRCPTN
jgi:hypothetical protein